MKGVASNDDRAEDGQGAGPVERLHDLIRRDIVEQHLAPGSRLKVADLAARYRTSTNPVREALATLQGEGIVVILPNRGAQVRDLGEAFVRNVYELRALIEPYLTRWFVDYAAPESIARLEELQQGMEETANDFDTHRDFNNAFHDTIFGGHYNREAVELERRQRSVLDILNRKFTIAPVRRRQIVEEHRGILDAIRRNDPDEAARVAGLHAKGAGQHLLDQMRRAQHAAETQRPTRRR